jgi:hypothetical protein
LVGGHVALHQKLQDFSLTVCRIWLHHSRSIVLSISLSAITDANSAIE